MSYSRCVLCHDYHFDTDKCKPKFEYQIPEYHGEEEWYEVRAYTFEEAAEQACENYDMGGDYDIVGHGFLDEIHIRDIEGTVKRFSISAYAQPVYNATELKD